MLLDILGIPEAEAFQYANRLAVSGRYGEENFRRSRVGKRGQDHHLKHACRGVSFNPLLERLVRPTASSRPRDLARPNSHSSSG
jgi:hypothetical protein